MTGSAALRSSSLGCVALLCACGASSRPPPEGDAAAGAGRDAESQPIGSQDAGERLPSDRDGDDEDEAPQWELFPGLPEYCSLYRATNPERVFQVDWGGPGSVQEMILPSGYHVAPVREAGFHDGETGYFALYLLSDDQAITVFLTTDGRTAGAFRNPRFSLEGPQCWIEPVTVGRAGWAFGIVTYEDDAWDRQHRIYRGPLDDLTTTDEPAAVLEAGSFHFWRSSPQATLSDEAIGLVFPSDFVARVDDGGVDFFPPIDDEGGQSGPISIVGRDMFWTDDTTYDRVAHAPPEGESGLFFEASIGDHAFGFRTDGDVMIWTESGPDGNGFESSGWLMVAPYTTDPAEIVPRVVTYLPTVYIHGVWGGGLWAYTDGTELFVYDLEDGSMRRYAPAWWGWADQPLYVTRSEILIPLLLRGAKEILLLHLDELDWEANDG